MKDLEVLETQIHELQAQLAFQEDTIQSLNKALASQQHDMLLMQKKLSLLTEQYQALQSSFEGIKTDNEPPPHY